VSKYKGRGPNLKIYEFRDRTYPGLFHGVPSAALELIVQSYLKTVECSIWEPN